MRVARTLFTLTIAGLFLVAAPACNTMKGAGKDIERGGQKIQKIAS
jgi:predicted small secreted protein